MSQDGDLQLRTVDSTLMPADIKGQSVRVKYQQQQTTIPSPSVSPGASITTSPQLRPSMKDFNDYEDMSPGGAPIHRVNTGMSSTAGTFRSLAGQQHAWGSKVSSHYSAVGSRVGMHMRGGSGDPQRGSSNGISPRSGGIVGGGVGGGSKIRKTMTPQHEPVVPTLVYNGIYSTSFPEMPPSAPSPSPLQRLGAVWDTIIDTVILRWVYKESILPEDPVHVRLRKGVMGLTLLGSLMHVIGFIVMQANPHPNDSHYLASAIALGVWVATLLLIDLPCFMWVRHVQSCPTWMISIHQYVSLFRCLFGLMVDPTLAASLPVFYAVTSAMLCQVVGVPIVVIVSLFFMWLGVNDCRFESGMVLLASTSPSPSGASTTSSSVPQPMRPFGSDRITFWPLTFDAIGDMSSRARICSLYPFLTLVQVMILLYYNQKQFRLVVAKNERSAEMSRAAADLLMEYDTEGVTKVLNWYGEGVRIPALVSMDSKDLVLDAAGGAGGTKTTPGPSPTKSQEGATNPGMTPTANTGLTPAHSTPGEATPAALPEGLQLSLYDMSSIEADGDHRIPVDPKLVQVFRAIVTNLERYKPHLPNYVLQPPVVDDLPGLPTGTTPMDEVDEGDLNRNGTVTSSGIRSNASRVMSEASPSQGSLSYIRHSSSFRHGLIQSFGGSSGDAAAAINGSYHLRHSNSMGETFTGLVTTLTARIRWASMENFPAKAANQFVGVLHELSTATSASLHTIVGDAILATWNATHRATRHEMRACRFALQLQTALEDDFAESLLLQGTAIVTGKAVCITAGDSRLKMFSLSPMESMGWRFQQELLSFSMETGPKVIVLDDRTAELSKVEFNIRGVGAISFSSDKGGGGGGGGGAGPASGGGADSTDSGTTTPTSGALGGTVVMTAAMMKLDEEKPRPIYELLSERSEEQKEDEWMYELEKRKEDPNEQVTAALFCYMEAKYGEAATILDHITDPTVLGSRTVQSLQHQVDVALTTFPLAQ